mmetsp:Transcript_42891/g.99434  ORF Transcript_42891/g.99434 Transcript_42891/m.99434 type:complete len:147 (-) Transcript_42891:118-558(-)
MSIFQREHARALSRLAAEELEARQQAIMDDGQEEGWHEMGHDGLELPEGLYREVELGQRESALTSNSNSLRTAVAAATAAATAQNTPVATDEWSDGAEAASEREQVVNQRKEFMHELLQATLIEPLAEQRAEAFVQLMGDATGKQL